MKMLLPVALISFGVLTVSATEVLTNQETEAVISTLKFFKIGVCILTTEKNNAVTANSLRKLMKNSILTGFMEPEKLATYLRNSKPPDTKTGIIVKVEKSSHVKDLFIENQKRMLWYMWILISDDGLDDGIRIPFNCEFLVFKKKSPGTYKILENYHLKNSPTFSNDLGLWSFGRGLNMTSASFYDRRMDMKGVELVRINTENKVNCENYVIEKSAQNVWRELSKMLNFSLKEVNQSITVETGDNDPDGTVCIWGITGMDTNKDWIFASIGIFVKIATKFRSSSDVGWTAYVRPFKNEMWGAIGVWLCISTVVVFVVTGCSKKALYINIFTAFFCLCNSDPMATHPPDEPIPLPTKLVYLMILTVPSVIVPAYSAYILATLSIVLPVEPFNSLHGFIRDGSFKLSTVNDTFMQRYLKGSEDPEIKYIHDHLYVGHNKSAPSFKDLFQQICENNKLAGLIVDVKDFREMIECKMFIMKQEVMTVNCGFLLQRGSTLKKLMNEMFSLYVEKGIFHRPRAIKQGGIYSGDFGDETEELNSLNLFQMSAIFMLIPLGIILSVMVLAAEVTFYNKCRKFKTSKGLSTSA